LIHLLKTPFRLPSDRINTNLLEYSFCQPIDWILILTAIIAYEKVIEYILVGSFRASIFLITAYTSFFKLDFVKTASECKAYFFRTFIGNRTEFQVPTDIYRFSVAIKIENRQI